MKKGKRILISIGAALAMVLVFNFVAIAVFGYNNPGMAAVVSMGVFYAVNSSLKGLSSKD